MLDVRALLFPENSVITVQASGLKPLFQNENKKLARNLLKKFPQKDFVIEAADGNSGDPVRHLHRKRSGLF